MYFRFFWYIYIYHVKYFDVFLNCFYFINFSRMRSEGSRFIWGSGGEAVFAESCIYVGNRSRATATVCVTAVRLSTDTVAVLFTR